MKTNSQHETGEHSGASLCSHYIVDTCVCDDVGEPKGQCGNCGWPEEDHIKGVCDCSTLTPETDALRDLYENHEHRATVGDIWELCESLERERDEARRAAIRWQNAWMNDTPLHEMGSTLMPWSKMCIRAEIQS